MAGYDTFVPGPLRIPEGRSKATQTHGKYVRAAMKTTDLSTKLSIAS